MEQLEELEGYTGPRHSDRSKGIPPCDVGEQPDVDDQGRPDDDMEAIEALDATLAAMTLNDETY